MELEATKQFLLVKSVEEADPQGAVIPLEDRAVPDSDASEDDLLGQRAQRLHGDLAERYPAQVQVAMSASSSHAWVKIAIIAGAFLIGLATKQLGPERRVNVLAFPLLGVLAWNLLVYFASLLGGVLMRRSGTVSAALGSLLDRASGRALRRLESGGDQELAGGLSRFVSQWCKLTAKPRAARARNTLHLGAAALSIGVIAGMYWNGLAYQYLAAWESTFLSPAGVHSLFANLFAPASAISGIPVAGIDEIRAMELKTGVEGVSAANWIHQFAITVGLFVVLPRLLMAWAAHARATRLEAAIDPRVVAAEYIAKLLKTREGGNLMARIVPHRMELGSKERDRLRAFAHQLWGGQLWVEFADPIAYGDEDEAEFEKADFQMLVLNLSATPEDESQGRLVKRFRAQLTGDGLVLLEGAPFRERFGGLGEFERRLGERLEAWKTILGRAGVAFAVYDGDPDEARLAAAEAMMKPAAPAAGQS
jgi:hypothetical protein